MMFLLEIIRSLSESKVFLEFLITFWLLRSLGKPPSILFKSRIATFLAVLMFLGNVPVNLPAARHPFDSLGCPGPHSMGRNLFSFWFFLCPSKLCIRSVYPFMFFSSRSSVAMFSSTFLAPFTAAFTAIPPPVTETGFFFPFFGARYRVGGCVFVNISFSIKVAFLIIFSFSGCSRCDGFLLHVFCDFFFLAY